MLIVGSTRLDSDNRLRLGKVEKVTGSSGHCRFPQREVVAFCGLAGAANIAALNNDSIIILV